MSTSASWGRRNAPQLMLQQKKRPLYGRPRVIGRYIDITLQAARKQFASSGMRYALQLDCFL
jgi:hypothetical protein